MESIEARSERLKKAEAEAVKRKVDSVSPVPVSAADGRVYDSEDSDALDTTSPMSAAVTDALIYLREGMPVKEVLQMILIRNRITKEEAERIVNLIIVPAEPKTEPTEREADDYDDLQPDD